MANDRITKHDPIKAANKGQSSKPEIKDNYAFQGKWWDLKKERDMVGTIFSVVSYLKTNQTWRQQQAALFARLYGNMPLYSWLGVNLNKINAQYKFPSDRVTLNVIQSCCDTLKAKIAQSKPRPVFLTSGGDYKKRKLSKELNKFCDGELYRLKANEILQQVCMDSFILGTGIVKIFEKDKKVAIERTLCTELFVDEVESLYGNPRQLHQLKLIDRSQLCGMFPDHKVMIMAAEAGQFDASGEASRSIADQIMVVESWHLRSSEDSKDGKHVISINNGVLLEEKYEKSCFPFVFFNYAPRTLGFWAQGLAEQLMGLQNEINKLCYVIQQSINLIGVPRVFVEDGSKVVSAHINNQIGAIVKYQGTKPIYEVAPCVPAEIYQERDRLVQYSYRISGISEMQASAMKPAGLDSGEAIKAYDNISSDRFAITAQNYEKMFIDLAYQIIDKAQQIYKEEGSYSTVAPGKNAVKKIDFPDFNLEKDDFIIQCFPESSLPKEPAGRLDEVQKLMQAGMISPKIGKQLLHFPDLDFYEDISNAPLDYIEESLDKMIEEGIYTPPEPYDDLSQALQFAIWYYARAKRDNAEESKLELIRQYIHDVTDLQQAAIPPQQPVAPQPQAQPEQGPTSQLLPNVPQG
jgi:hypothetical protein